MAKDKYETKFVLLETNSLDSILSPLKGTQRIKYTCFDVSQNFLIFGATSGGIYIFSRDPCHFLLLLPNKDGSLNNVSISPDEKFIGFSTSRGIAAVLERSDEGGAYLISRSDEHCGANITLLSWSESSNQLYIADDSGQLSVINISLFINKSIFQLPSHVIIKLDSEIFQVSCCGELLLVSTRTRCYLCDTVKEQYKQIGTKLREGVFGACFIKHSNGVTKAFCARPGSRLWEVDINGSVLCTHQFKEALTLNSSILISLIDKKIHKSEFSQWQEQAPVNFPYLFPVLNKYLFTFKQDCFYIFDPEKIEIIVHCNRSSNVVDAKCVANSIYTWNSNGIIEEFILTPVENCLLNLYFRGAYSLCIEMCEHFGEYIQALDYDKLVMMSPLLGLTDHIDNLHTNINFTNFFINLNNCCNIQSFKLNLNDTLDSNVKIPKVCDKTNTIFSSNSDTSQRCQPKYKSVECVLGKLSEDDKRSTFVKCIDNNLHNNEILIDNLSPYLSNKSISPVSLASVPMHDLYSSFLEHNKSINGKAIHGTKSLIKKWQIFEDKFNSLKKKSNCQIHISKDFAIQNLSDSDDSVVTGREMEKYSFVIPAINVSPLIDICDILIKSDNSCRVDLFAQFLKCLFVVYNEYKDVLINENKLQRNKLFPLSKYLPAEYVKIVEKCFYDITNAGDLIKCLNILPGEFIESALLPVKYPNVLLSLHCPSVLNLDIALSNVIFILIDVLDPFTILQSIDSADIACSFMSWNVVLQSFQENTFDYITVPQESYKFNDWPLPVILNIIFLMLRLDQVESACYISREISINIRHISYLILRFQLQLESNGMTEEECCMHCNKLFLKYLSCLIEENVDLFKNMIDQDTVKHIENAVLDVSNIASCDNCDFSLNEKKTESVDYNAIGELLLQYYTAHDCDTEKVNDLCDTDGKELNVNDLSHPDNYHEPYFNLQNGFNKNICKESAHKIINLVKILPNIVIKILQLNFCKINEILNFIAQFGLINNVEPFLSNLSAQDWIVLCECYKDLSQGLCCICHHPVKSPGVEIEWNSLAIAMLQSLGSTTSIAILSDYSGYINSEKLYLSFYRTAILSDLIMLQTFEHTSYKHVMNMYCRQFIKEPIDSHLSQIGIVSMWEAESSDGLLPSVVYSKDRKHWGIMLDVDTDICSKCSLILNSEKLLKDGIRGFKCGHIYHVLCLRLCNSLFECCVCS